MQNKKRTPGLVHLLLLSLVALAGPAVYAATGAAPDHSVAYAAKESDSISVWLISGLVIIACTAIGFVSVRYSERMAFSTKFTLLIGTLLFLMTTISVITIRDMSLIGEELVQIAEEDIPLTTNIARITAHQLEQALWLERAALASGLAAKNNERLQQAFSEYQRLGQQVDRELTEAEELAEKGIRTIDNLAAQEEYRLVLSSLQDIHSEHELFNTHGASLFELIRAERLDEAAELLVIIEAEEDKLDHALIELEEEISAFTIASALAAERHEINAFRTILIVATFSILFAIALSIYTTRSLLSQLGADPRRLSEVAGELAAGDLRSNVDNAKSGAYLAVADTVRKLREVIQRIQAASTIVTQASEEVAQGNTNLSQRTQEQASNLEEVAASMEEMTATVNQNAQNAQDASALANTARDQAQNGGEVVTQSMGAMEEINLASRKISDIIGVIDEIAFQTNLLALNAAVEAARAGEQGRGFAVVASEVRNLAGRSATAAKEIKELIEDSVSKVDEGSRLVNESGEALSEIVESVKKVSNIVAEIAAASQEQSSGIGQVNTAVTQMDEMTQENAALVEESAAASEALGAEADALRTAIRFFALEAEEHVKSASKPTLVAVDSPKDSEKDQSNWQPQPALAFGGAGATDGEWRDF